MPEIEIKLKQRNETVLAYLQPFMDPTTAHDTYDAACTVIREVVKAHLEILAKLESKDG